MKITKQDNKFNQFNIENLTVARVLSIINALEYCHKQGLTTKAGEQLLEALKSQQHKLILNSAIGTKYCRKCSSCGQGMNKGFVINSGEQHFCSEPCIRVKYTPEEYKELHDDGNGDAYYTEWDATDESELQYQLNESGKLTEIN